MASTRSVTWDRVRRGTRLTVTFFDVYALNKKLNLPAKASKKDAVKAIDGHVLGWGEVVGRFGH